MNQKRKIFYLALAFIPYVLGILTLSSAFYCSLVFLAVASFLIIFGFLPKQIADCIAKDKESYFLNVLLIVLVINFLFVMPYSYRDTFEYGNLKIVDELSNPTLQEKFRFKMKENYTLSELLDWVHDQIVWVDLGELSNRSSDPFKIIDSGKGHCGEFAILYFAGCLSLGYEARWIVSVRPYNFSGLHNWVEVKVDNSWVHVDPREKKWNEPSMYKDGNWWGIIGKDAFVYAFEKGKNEDVTDRYG